MSKLNCWQFKKCERQPGGSNAKSQGVCPASTEARLEGVNSGERGGRACWVVAGTMCNGDKPQGTFADKYRDCAQCDFFNLVRKEEGEGFEIASIDIYKKA